MVTEQDKTLEALEVAVQMEIDGKECYLKASEESRNEAGKKLLQLLANEEDVHQRKFEEIYDAIRSKKGWPIIDFRPDQGERLRADFSRTCEVIGGNVSGLASELEAIKTAIDKERESHGFYERHSKNAACRAERYFYESVAVEEREHALILLDYYEYLTDPAGWFIKKEHSSFDGG